MIWVMLCLLVAVAIGLIVWTHSEPSPPSPPPNPEHLQKAAVELHRIRRQREKAELQHHQRREVVRVKREIAEALEGEEP
jgi:hypothetical protein